MRALCGFVALCALVAGCGSHVVIAEQTKRSDASETTPDTGISDGTGAEGADAAPVTLCGKARCKDLSDVIPKALSSLIPGTGMVPAYACCADVARSRCGVVELGQCVELNHPGHADPSCHGPLSSADLPDCCRPDGTCGVLDTQYFGCAQVPFLPASIAGTCVYQ